MIKERTSYPALLWLTGREAVVVGGGPVALHRIEGLLEAGVKVRVIAPEAVDEIVNLVVEGQIKWHKEPFATSMIRGASIVICATDVASARPACCMERTRIRLSTMLQATETTEQYTAVFVS